jgi:hypothetical protein
MLQQEGMSNGMQACHFHERMSHVASTTLCVPILTLSGTFDGYKESEVLEVCGQGFLAIASPERLLF